MPIPWKLILEPRPLVFGSEVGLGFRIGHMYSRWQLASFSRIGYGVLVDFSIGIVIFAVVCSSPRGVVYFEAVPYFDI